MRRSAKILPFRAQEPSATPLVALTDVVVRADNQLVLHGARVRLESRGITGVIGPNGAGKSVMLRAIAGLLAPDHGEITVSESLGAPAMVFQKPVLLRRSVKANLIHALRLAGVPRREQTGRLSEILVRCGLAHVAEAPARHLSGGQQQRVAIARALASKPRLLLMDEPTASLDPAATAEVEALIRDTALAGVKVVLVTHNTAQAARLCEDIVFVHRGLVLEHAPAQRFFDHPQTPEAEMFLRGGLLL